MQRNAFQVLVLLPLGALTNLRYVSYELSRLKSEPLVVEPLTIAAVRPYSVDLLGR